MDFRESSEQEQLRRAVRDVAAGFGHRYYAEKANRGEKTDELWAAMAELATGDAP